MRSEERVPKLVELIYAAVVEPDCWNDFLTELSAALGGAAVSLSLRLPETLPSSDAYYRVGLDPAYYPLFIKHAISGLPWGSPQENTFQGRFGLASEVVAEDDIEEAPFYREYMKPQGLAPEWPICHVICTEEGRPLSGMAIYRREGCRPLGSDDLDLLGMLVPHLSRAYAIHRQLNEVSNERRALAEVMDRLPMGVILLDAEGRAVLMNHSAQNLLALHDGFRLEQGRPTLDDSRQNRSLRALIATSLEAPAGRGRAAGGVMSATRPSGRRHFPLMIGPLLAAPPDAGSEEARAILFIADPDSAYAGTTEVLESLYQLTHAEAELVRLVADGHSLDAVAAERGVTMNTVRSQLKQVFSKTDTSRQGELVHLVLSGVAALRERESD